jgi:hypothetical protein
MTGDADLIFGSTMSPSRLRLVDGTLALLSAALEGRNALEGLLGVPVAEDWEGFPNALPILRASYERQPEGHRWRSLFFIELGARTRVLQKTGFRKVAEMEDPDEGPIWQWRLERPTH